MVDIFRRTAFVAFFALAALTVFASDRAWAPTMMEYAVILGLNRASCTVVDVVDGELETSGKMIAGPFRSREEAVKAMQGSPECQSSGK